MKVNDSSGTCERLEESGAMTAYRPLLMARSDVM